MYDWFINAYEQGFLAIFVFMLIVLPGVGAALGHRLARSVAKDAIWTNNTMTPREKAKMLGHVYGKPPEHFIAQLEWEDRQRAEFLERHNRGQ